MEAKNEEQTLQKAPSNEEVAIGQLLTLCLATSRGQVTNALLRSAQAMWSMGNHAASQALINEATNNVTKNA